MVRKKEEERKSVITMVSTCTPGPKFIPGLLRPPTSPILIFQMNTKGPAFYRITKILGLYAPLILGPAGGSGLRPILATQSL